MEGGTTGPIHFLNLEYFFRLLYESRVGITGTTTAIAGPDYLLSSFVAWVANTWSVLGAVSFVFSLAAFAILAYSTVRMYQLKMREEHERWSTLDPVIAETKKDHSRWAHIQSLLESLQPRDWREAIMEADIMLEDALVERGYVGTTTGERLKGANLKTINEAWEAHKVRNSIAHEGIAFELTDRIAYRTIKKYEMVFKELGEL
jgi:hypothetical protein